MLSAKTGTIYRNCGIRVSILVAKYYLVAAAETYPSASFAAWQVEAGSAAPLSRSRKAASSRTWQSSTRLNQIPHLPDWKVRTIPSENSHNALSFDS